MSAPVLQKSPVSVVMPVYNEEDIIEKTVRDYHSEIVQNLPGSEMIIVNDCSTDNTPNILVDLATELNGIKILQPARNGGHGKALRLAYENASLGLIFHTDSDYQYDPEDFWKLYSESNGNDLVIGYRAVRKDPVARLVITNMLRLFNLALFRFNIKDANSPFRIIRKECMDECLRIIDPDAFAPSIMMALIAKWMGYRIREIPVTHLPRLTGQVSIKKWKLINACILSMFQTIELKKKLSGANASKISRM